MRWNEQKINNIYDYIKSIIIYNGLAKKKPIISNSHPIYFLDISLFVA
jgi:hypothetical protein